MMLPKPSGAAAPRVSLPVIQPEPLVVGHVSASQFKTYSACPRQWWFDKVAKVPRPSRPHLDFGTEVHAHLENWLNYGTEPPVSAAGSVARNGLHLLPDPQTPGVQVEQDLSPALYIVPDVLWAGRMDVWAAPGVLGPQALILDHKTTKDWRWCKSPDELATDPQLVSYALWSMEHHGGDTVSVSHVYYHTKPTAGMRTRARRVDAEVRRDAALYAWDDYSKVVRQLVADGLKVDPQAVAPNWDACGMYGGCQYRERCSNTMSTPKLSLGAALSRNADPAVQSPATTSAPPAAPRGLVLYLGCAPMHGPDAGAARPLDALVAEYAAPLCEAHGVVDLRLIPYAQGKGLLAGAFRASPPEGVFYTGAETELNAVAVEALAPMADVVVRALR